MPTHKHRYHKENKKFINEIAEQGGERVLNSNGEEIARDIVIPVIGQSGAGKSTFINAVLGENIMAVSSDMDACTLNIAIAPLDISKFPDFQWLSNRRLFLIDTPGFDDAYTNGPDLLKQIAEGLGDSYHRKMVLGGVIFLRDISDDRFTGTARKSLVLFNQLCGKGALRKVVLGITKSNRLLPNQASKREDRFKEVHWKEMVDKGAQVFRFDEGNSDQALKFVNAILERFSPEEIRDSHSNTKKSGELTLTWTTAWEFLAAWTAIFGSIWRADRHHGQP